MQLFLSTKEMIFVAWREAGAGALGFLAKG